MAIPSRHSVEQFVGMLRGVPGAQGFQVSDRGTYLGVLVGPAAGEEQWRAVCTKLRAHQPDVKHGQGLAARMALVRVFCTRLVLYKAHFAPGCGIREAYHGAAQRLTQGPWTAVPIWQ